MTKELFAEARELLRKIAAETNTTKSELNAWNALDLSRRMGSADEPSARPTCPKHGTPLSGLATGELVCEICSPGPADPDPLF